MHGREVVPDKQVEELAFVAKDELGLRGMRSEFSQQRAALVDRPADDMRGVGGEIEHPAARSRVHMRERVV